MKDALGEKIESKMFNSYDVADALMELCGFDYDKESLGYFETEYADLYEELEKELFNLKTEAEKDYTRDSMRTLWNILGMVGVLGTRTGNWHTADEYTFNKPNLSFPSHEEF